MRRLLFILQSDPRHSSRPAETLRMVQGLAAWKQVDVFVFIDTAASFLLREESAELPGQRILQQSLQDLAARGALLAPQSLEATLGKDGPAYPTQFLDPAAIARFCRECNSVCQIQ